VVAAAGAVVEAAVVAALPCPADMLGPRRRSRQSQHRLELGFRRISNAHCWRQSCLPRARRPRERRLQYRAGNAQATLTSNSRFGPQPLRKEGRLLLFSALSAPPLFGRASTATMPTEQRSTVSRKVAPKSINHLKLSQSCGPPSLSRGSGKSRREVALQIYG
jgi:hypothetical protein